MWRSPEPRYDVASGLSQGGRDYQEDAIVTDFPFGMDSGIVVLADGMGGHEAGDVASKIVVTEVYSELKFCSATFAEDEAAIPRRLAQATSGANATIRDYVKENPDAYSMGATLVSVVMVENRMFWMSVGDSPLYVLRDGKLTQLNEDHSMAPQIDFMVKQGILSEDAGRDHPDRHCLTSVIIGGRIPKSDCPLKPFELKLGDVIVVSSDGLQYLGHEKMQKVVHRYRRRKSAEIAGHLLEAVAALNHPDQDNVSFSVIKLNHMKPVERKIKPKPIGKAASSAASLSRVIPMVDAPEADAPANTSAAPVQPNPSKPADPPAATEMRKAAPVPTAADPVASPEPAPEQRAKSGPQDDAATAQQQSTEAAILSAVAQAVAKAKTQSPPAATPPVRDATKAAAIAAVLKDAPDAAELDEAEPEAQTTPARQHAAGVR